MAWRSGVRETAAQSVLHPVNHSHAPSSGFLRGISHFRDGTGRAKPGKEVSVRIRILLGPILAVLIPLLSSTSPFMLQQGSGAVSGTVFDPDGRPMQNSAVGLLHIGYTRGKRSIDVIASKRSDNRGEFRFYPVPSGEYYVAAAPAVHEDDGDMPAVTTLHPSAAYLSAASKVVVQDAGEVKGIDIHVRAAQALGRNLKGVVEAGYEGWWVSSLTAGGN